MPHIMPDNATTAPLFKQVTCLGPQPHLFGQVTAIIVPADKSPSKFEQHEKTCPRCGITRITVCEGKGRREWRWPGKDEPQVGDDFRPECVSVEAGKGG